MDRLALPGTGPLGLALFAWPREGQVHLLRSPHPFAQEVGLVHLHEGLFEEVEEDPGTGRWDRDCEGRIFAMSRVRPQLLGEGDEAALGLPQCGETEPRRRDVMLPAW